MSFIDFYQDMNIFNNHYVETMISTRRRRISDELLLNNHNSDDSGFYCSDNEKRLEREKELISSRKPLTEKCFITNNGLDIFGQGMFKNNFDEEPIFC